MVALTSMPTRCFGSDPISDALSSLFAQRAPYAKRMVSEREHYLATTGADTEVFGTHWGREFFDTVALGVGRADPEILNRIRLVFNFSGFPIVQYRRSETFPTSDPVLDRYLKLRHITPPQYRFSAPAIAGEAGWVVDDGLVNVDTAITQERLQFLYFGGVLDWLSGQSTRRQESGQTSKNPSIMEIGAGCGMTALATIKAIPSARYFICDVPEVLSISFAYLNITVPDHGHFVILPDGIYDAASNQKVALDEIQRGFVYIPNYMMHSVDRQIEADMIYNAMSLHEMRSAQIDYYCQFMKRATSGRDGIFVDVNAHFGRGNTANDPSLEQNFAYTHNLDFVDLALCARIWTNSENTFQSIKTYHQNYKKNHPLDDAFRFEDTALVPEFSTDFAFRTLNEDLGSYIGVEFASWMGDRGYAFADHLGGYRLRFPAPAVTQPSTRSSTGKLRSFLRYLRRSLP